MAARARHGMPESETMSHTSTIKVKFEDKEALKAACKSLGLHFQEGSHSVQLYGEKVKTDFSIKLEGWRYPVAICGDEIKYDSYNGAWGHMRELERLQDEYSKQVTVALASRLGMTVNEEVSQEGEITLTLYDYST